jgi:hypothetical protein
LIFAARQFGSHGVCRSSWCLLFVHLLSGARVPQLVARHPVLRDATHALGEQTPLLVSSLAILSRRHYNAYFIVHRHVFRILCGVWGKAKR